MIRLQNNGEKTFVFDLTANPITRPEQSPQPTGKKISNDMTVAEQKEIREHTNYSKSYRVELAPGINEIENDEQAEYIYQIMGNPESGGDMPVGDKWLKITNNNFVLEVDDKGKEIKTNLFKKYRVLNVPSIARKYDASQFKLQE